MAIRFFNEDSTFLLKDKKKIKEWIKKVVEQEGFSTGDLNYIFCSDEHLLKINQEYLNHNYFTDIITFDQSEGKKKLAGDIYISIERVEENSHKNGVPFMEELMRVVIHGVLHLLGYSDNSKEEKLVMRKKEEACLSLC